MKKILAIVTFSLIILCGGVFAGCGEPEGELNLLFNAGKIEMLISDESLDYTICVENLDRAASFEFDFETAIASIVPNSVQEIGNGEYQFSIVPNAPGETVLKITLRGTDKFIDVPVLVSEAVQSFSPLGNIFVVKGQSITLNSSYFSFEPKKTTQTGLEFALKEGQTLVGANWNEETNTLSVDAISTMEIVSFIATSTHDSSKTQEFDVKIVSEVNVSSLEVISYGQSEENPEIFDVNKDLTVYPYVTDINNKILNNIELVVNDNIMFRKKISVNFNFIQNSNIYVMDVFASEGIMGEIAPGSPITGQIKNFEFVIQSNAITTQNEPHKITFVVYQADYPANFKEIEIYVYVTTRPTEIRINEQSGEKEVELYHNSTQSSDFRLSVFPDISGIYNQNEYYSSISVFTTNNKIDKVPLSLGNDGLKQYATVTYGGKELAEFDAAELANIARLDGILNIRAKETTGELYIAFVFECFNINNNVEPVCSNTLFIKIYKGTSTFTFSDDYLEKEGVGILYLAMPKENDFVNPYGIQYFSGFEYDENSTIGQLIIEAKNPSDLACEVSQKEDIIPTLILTPQKVGTSEFILQTQNGKILTLKVIVVREIDQSDFAIEIEDNNKNSISEFKMNNKTSSLEKIIVKGKGGLVYLKENIKRFEDVNENSYEYVITIDAANQEYFVVNGNVISSKEFTQNPVTANVVLTIKKVDAFKLIDVEYAELINFNFELECIDYFKSMNITVKNETSGDGQKALSVYDKNVLSYINQNMAEAYIYLDLNKSDSSHTHISNITVSNFKISAGRVSNGQVGQIGTFEVTEYDPQGNPLNGQDYIAKFVCNIRGINTTSSFTITLQLTDETGTEFESYVTIYIEKYIDVDSIYTTTPTSEIYLDATESNRSYSFGVYVMPTNAMCQDIHVVIDTIYTNCISYSVTGKTLTFTYVTGGRGTIRIFPVSKMKTSGTKDANGEYYYHIAIKFTSADGESEATALKLFSYEDIRSINPNKHYFMDSIIDCNGQDLYIKEFNNGSIRGTYEYFGEENFENAVQVGGLKNVIVKNRGINTGIFGIISPNAKLYNFSISGRFATNGWELTEGSNIGLLCGTNEGNVFDVQVTLNSNTNLEITTSSENDISVYVGLVAGLNKGTLSIRAPKVSTLMTYMQNSLEIDFGDKINAFVGAVVGNNGERAVISNQYSNADFVNIGMFGIHALANIKAESKALGGVAGENSGTIFGIKITGEIEGTLGSAVVGGLIGNNMSGGSIVETNTSRVFVRGYNVVAGLIGSVAQESVNNVKNNKVQATDDGTRTGISASLIINFSNIGRDYAISPVTLDASNIAETYFTREKTDSISNALPIDYYYGDKICINKAGTDLKSNSCFDIKGQNEQVLPSISTFVMAIYKEAIDSDKQMFINNNVKSINIMKVAGISAKELDIKVSSTALASLINFGESISINNTGLVKLTITSSLNYSNSCELNIYLTRYYSDIKAYLDKDYIESVNNIDVVNAKSKAIYLKCYSNEYNYQNTPIALYANDEITFYCDESDVLDIVVSAQTMHITAKQQKIDSKQLTIYPIFADENAALFAKYSEEIGVYIFHSKINDDQRVKLNNLHVNVKTGIENIQIGKSEVVAEPSDTVQIEIEYTSYNAEDYIVPKLQIGNKVYTLEQGSNYFTEGVNKLFELQLVNSVSNGNKVKEIYALSMEISKNNYLNYRNETVCLYFYSNATNEFNSINIKYTPETISSVLINNYSYEENDDMIKTNANKLEYFEENMAISSLYSSSGDYNILKTFVYTQLSEFDYVEISMNPYQSGGYLALGANGTISTKSVYTEIENVVTMRVYKNDIISESERFDEPRLLEFSIIYSLPVGMTEGTRVPIEFVFFKSGEVPTICYQKEINVIAKSAKKVEFTILDKEPLKEDIEGINKVYNVVKGKKYPLQVNVVGYIDEEIVFESSNPNIAKVTYENGVYYLNILSNTIDYEGKPYFELIISSYGEKKANNTTLKCKEQKTMLKVYEFVLNDKNPFNNTHVSLRALNAVDIRDIIIEKLKGNIEYGTYVHTIDEFLKDFKENSTWEIVSNGITVKISDATNISSQNYTLKGYNFKPIVVTDSAPYKFRVHYKYAYKSGEPTCDNINGDPSVISGFNLFDVEVYINSSEDLPTPIYNYKDLQEMKDGEYYRLVSDITIKSSEFVPIKSKPKCFDGNGYTITFTGEKFGANTNNITYFGLFETIASGAVFKNITIILDGRKTVDIDNNVTSNSVYIGVLTAENNGVITNCKVVCENILYVNVIATVNVMESSYFGTICAINNGYITHCQVKANVSVSGASVGGLVANNVGHISSSYVKNSRIANTTSSSNENIVTGGFVCVNEGEISMSYIEGSQSSNKIYSDFVTGEYGLTSKILYTSSEVGGFIYKNTGVIEDSYANIPVVSASRCAGFVGINEGKIERVYSLSKMKQRDTLSHAFAIRKGESALFKDCFFIVEAGIINDNTSESNYIKEGNKYKAVIQGVEPLQIADFNVVDENGNLNTNSKFAHFITASEKNSSGGIWFYTFDKAKQNALHTNKLTYTCDVEEFKYYNITTKKFETQQFNAGRLQLVSPNLLSSSRYNLNINGEEYYYSIEDQNIAYGSKYNPYIISSALELEDYGHQKNGDTLEYFRLVKDINYENEEVFTTKLFDKQLVAYFEGNNLDIAGYSVNSKSSIISAGLFAQIGGQYAMFSTIKNINFAPSYINLPNSVYVGGIAGSAVRSRIYNINLNGGDVVIVGKNIVGGLFGRTFGETYVRDAFANVIVKSSKYGSSLSTNKNDMNALLKTICFKEDGSNRADISYSGGLIGYVGGLADISYVEIGDKVKAYGVIAGLMFGGTGVLSNVHSLALELNSFDNSVTAYAFGGLITGESNGQIKNILINSNIIAKNMFTCYPFIPIAIGGVAGIMPGGKIFNISSSEGFTVIGADFTSVYGQETIGGKTYTINYINNPFVVKYVGGIVGYGVKGEISNINIFGLKTSETANTGNYDIVDHNIVTNENGQYIKETNSNKGIMVLGSNYVGAIAGYLGSYLNNGFIVKNVDINLIGVKEYVNQSGEKIEEMVYMSYVSEASYSQNPNLTFDDTISDGILVAGMAEKPVEEESVNVEDLNITISGNVLFKYFGTFAGVVGTMQYYPFGSAVLGAPIILNPTIYTKLVNLSTGNE